MVSGNGKPKGRMDLIVIPGGFSYGRLFALAGAMARNRAYGCDVIAKGRQGSAPLLGLCKRIQTA